MIFKNKQKQYTYLVWYRDKSNNTLYTEEYISLKKLKIGEIFRLDEWTLFKIKIIKDNEIFCEEIDKDIYFKELFNLNQEFEKGN